MKRKHWKMKRGAKIFHTIRCRLWIVAATQESNDGTAEEATREDSDCVLVNGCRGRKRGTSMAEAAMCERISSAGSTRTGKLPGRPTNAACHGMAVKVGEWPVR